MMMRTAKLTLLSVAMLSAAAAISSAAFALAPEEQVFADAYIDAINSKSVEKRKAHIHPASLACINEVNKEFFNEMFEGSMRDSIPGDARISFDHSGKISMQFPVTLFTWPINPTGQFMVDYKRTPTPDRKATSVTAIRTIVKENGRILEVLACPTDKSLELYRKKQEKHKDEVKQ